LEFRRVLFRSHQCYPHLHYSALVRYCTLLFGIVAHLLLSIFLLNCHGGILFPYHFDSVFSLRFSTFLKSNASSWLDILMCISSEISTETSSSYVNCRE